MKDAVRLLVYLAATVLLGAVVAPILFWSAQWLAVHNIFPVLAKFDFETFFHRALLLAAALLLWPLLRPLRVRKTSDLALEPNPKWSRDLVAGFILSATPLLCCGGLLILFHIFSVRIAMTWPAFFKLLGATTAVPLIEEFFFRGLILGILLRAGSTSIAIFVTSALYSILHFLKAPERTSTVVSWTSGFNSIAHSFAQFSDPLLIAAGFTTLLLIGWLLADARLQTRSLWLPIGLHSGWIFASQAFNKFAHREMFVLPWLGKNLLVGIIPLLIIGLTWAIMHCWLNRHAVRQN